MLGFIFGTVCLIAFAKMARRSCYGHGYGGHCGGRGGGWGGGRWGGGWGGHWHGHGHGHNHGDESGPGGGPQWMMQRYVLRQLFERLDTTPGQEKVIVAAVDEVRTAVREARGEFKLSRDDLAKVMAGDIFDENTVGSTFARQDDALTTVRKAVTGALAKVHDALDSKQRARLAELISEGPGGWGRYRGGGPYRGAHI
jgi:hypothetical protein